jgi:hypothetical protein
MTLSAYDLIRHRILGELYNFDRLPAQKVRLANTVHTIHDPTLRRQDDRVIEFSFIDAFGMFGDTAAGWTFIRGIAKP